LYEAANVLVLPVVVLPVVVLPVVVPVVLGLDLESTGMKW
jgi:hypothetical protein